MQPAPPTVHLLVAFHALTHRLSLGEPLKSEVERQGAALTPALWHATVGLLHAADRGAPGTRVDIGFAALVHGWLGVDDERGFEEAIGDPQAGVDVLVAENPGEIDEAIDRPGADLLVPMWQLPAGGGFGTQEPARWNSFVQWMKDNDMLDQSLDASAAYRADLGN